MKLMGRGEVVDNDDGNDVDDADFIEVDNDVHKATSLYKDKKFVEDVDKQLNEILLGLGSDETQLKISVRRIIEGTGTTEKCFSAFASEGSDSIEKKIEKEWGPGAYHVYVNGMKGRMITRFITRIGTPLKTDNHDEYFKHSMDIQQRQNERMDMLQQRHSEKMETILLAFIDKGGNNKPVEKPPLDIAGLITAGTGALVTLVGLMPRKETLGDRIKELQALNGIAGIKDNDKEDNDKSKEELVKAIAPAVGEIAKVFVNRYGQMPQQQQQQPQPQPQQQQQPQQPQQQVEQQPEETEEERMALFNIQVKGLVNKAKANCTVELYADVIMDTFPRNEIKGFFAKGDPIQNLTIVNPEVANYREWFERLITEVRRLVKEEEDLEDEKEAEEIEKINASKNNEPDETK